MINNLASTVHNMQKFVYLQCLRVFQLFLRFQNDLDNSKGYYREFWQHLKNH